MSPHILNSTLILASSLTLLFLLWKTNSLRTSTSTTVAICTVSISAILFILDQQTISLILAVISMSVMVWRVIPHDTTDTWVKG